MTKFVFRAIEYIYFNLIREFENLQCILEHIRIVRVDVELRGVPNCAFPNFYSVLFISVK